MDRFTEGAEWMREIVHTAISRALDEAGIMNVVHRAEARGETSDLVKRIRAVSYHDAFLVEKLERELAAAKRGVVVPREPTAQMLDILKQVADHKLGNVNAYRAMLAAAPQQNTAQEDQPAER